MFVGGNYGALARSLVTRLAITSDLIFIFTSFLSPGRQLPAYFSLPPTRSDHVTYHLPSCSVAQEQVSLDMFHYSRSQVAVVQPCVGHMDEH